MARNPLEWAYKNDLVSTMIFSKSTLRKYEKAGLLEHKRTEKKGPRKGRRIYWITEKGLKCYLGELPKSKCRVR